MLRTSAKWFMVMTAAALLFSSLAGNAAARSLSSQEQSFSVTWNSVEFGSSAATIRCRLTLEGSFHSRTIAKIARSLIGYVTRAIVGRPCTGGEAWSDNGAESEPLGTAPNKLPFHLTYESFSGTLPAIAEVNFLLRDLSVVIQSSFIGIACRARYGRPEDNVIEHGAREASGGITSLGVDATVNRISRVDQLVGSVCPVTGAFRGTSNAPSALGSGGLIRISLI